jgi:hypothetical protein
MATTMVSNDPEHQRGDSTQWTGSPGRRPFDQKDNPTQPTLRKFTAAWPLVIFLLLPVLTRAETAVQAWVQRYSGTAHAVAVDGSNNVVVTGSQVRDGNAVAYATIKYSSSGYPLWTNIYKGYGGAWAVAVDGSNNVIVTGSSPSGAFPGPCATIKYSSDGVPLWTNRYHWPPSGMDCGTAVAVDGGNNVIVTGYSSTVSQVPAAYVTIKYSSDGVPLWTNRYDGPGNSRNYATSVAVDGSNNVIVTGTSGSNYVTIAYSTAGVALWTNFYSGGIATSVAVDSSNNVIVAGFSWSAYDYAAIKYSSAGIPLWTNSYKGTGPTTNFDTPPHQLAVDGSNNVVVVGCLYDNLYQTVYATTKYSSGGVPLWTNCYNGGGNGIAWAYAVAVDGSNNVVVTGNSSSDYATIKYSSAGVPLWTNRYSYLGPSQGWDDPCAVAVDHSGNVIVAGSSQDGTYNSYFATIKYICVPSPVMTGLQLTNGTFQMRVDDVLQPGTLVIEASTNLAGWAPVFTNTTPANVLFYTDPDASNYLRRFYRAFQFP